jgi:hypothetical protein
MAGPIQGPRSTGIDHTAIALPRSSWRKQSATVPGPMVKGHAPTRPVRKRKTMSMGMLTDKPQATFMRTKRTEQTW